MPSFIKTEKDEKVWARAKAKVHEQYPDISEDSDKFWALTTTIYKSMNKGNNTMKKSASGVVARLMAKKAYVPLTPAAQEAVAGQQAPPPAGMPPQDPSMTGGQPPMDPSMMGAPQGAPAGGMPPMPMDPSMMGGQPPIDPSMAGGQPMQTPPIPVVSGPNGEPVDAETGFIVVDFAQGIEQDPISGMLLRKLTGEFMTPDGQPIPPEQAMQMMAQASGGMPPQGGAPVDPSMTGGQPPMDPSMMGVPQDGAPMPPPEAQPMMQQQASAEDPMAMMGQGMPMQAPPIQGELNESAGMQVDPNTGMPIDPSTGMLIDPATGNLIDPTTGQPVAGGQIPTGAPAPMGGAGDATQLLESIPGLQEFINNTPKQMESLDKDIVKATHDIGGMRTDLQGIRRELSTVKDENRTLYDRMDNCLQVVEQLISMINGGSQDPIMGGGQPTPIGGQPNTPAMQ